MNNDDVIYATILFLCVPFGVLVKRASSPKYRQALCTGLGIGLVALICRSDGLHSLLTTVINCLIIKFVSPRWCHIVSFIWCFGYIGFFRTTHYFGLPTVVPHANAVQLLLTLKLVGLAYEVHDTYIQEKYDKDDERNGILKEKYQSVHPSFMEMFHYSYCYIGLMTGPYYKYRTYQDMLHNPNLSSIDSWTPMAHRLMKASVIGIVFIVLSYYYNINYCTTEEFFGRPAWYPFFFMVPMFTVFRTRVYFAWLLSECMCIAAGLGAYPAVSKPKCGYGPNDLKALDSINPESPELLEINFETVHNIDMWGCDFATTSRESMRSWNMTVQYWLAHHVYRRVPFKPLRTFTTMLVSSYWHGVHPGYYLSFMTVPLVLLAEDIMIKAFRSTEGLSRSIFNWFWWFVRMRYYEYMAMAFLVLTYEGTMNYWGSLYFSHHISMVCFYLLGSIYNTFVKKKID